MWKRHGTLQTRTEGMATMDYPWEVENEGTPVANTQFPFMIKAKCHRCQVVCSLYHVDHSDSTPVVGRLIGGCQLPECIPNVTQCRLGEVCKVLKVNKIFVEVGTMTLK